MHWNLSFFHIICSICHHVIILFRIFFALKFDTPHNLPQSVQNLKCCLDNSSRGLASTETINHDWIVYKWSKFVQNHALIVDHCIHFGLYNKIREVPWHSSKSHQWSQCHMSKYEFETLNFSLISARNIGRNICSKYRSRDFFLRWVTFLSFKILRWFKIRTSNFGEKLSSRQKWFEFWAISSFSNLKKWANSGFLTRDQYFN